MPMLRITAVLMRQELKVGRRCGEVEESAFLGWLFGCLSMDW